MGIRDRIELDQLRRHVVDKEQQIIDLKIRLAKVERERSRLIVVLTDIYDKV